MSVAKKRYAIAGVALGLTVLAVGPAMAETQPVSGPGVVAACAGTPLLVATGIDQVDQAQTLDQPVGVGGTCFVVPANAIGANVSVKDDSGNTIAYSVQYQAADGTNSATVDSGCADGSYALPSDIATSYLYVFTDDPATGYVDCGSTTVPNGTVTVDWVFPAV